MLKCYNNYMKNKYTNKDSALSFILSLVIPNVLAFLIILFAAPFFDGLTGFTNSKFYKIISTILSQICFVLIFLYITKSKKISLQHSVETKKLNFKQVLLLILIICMIMLSDNIIIEL